MLNPTEEQKTKTYYVLELATFSLFSIGSLVWRFLKMPSDEGGTFFHIWFSLIWLIASYRLSNSNRKSSRLFLCAVVLPLGCFVLIGSMRYAVQTVLPFMILLGFFVAIWIFSKDKLKLVIICLTFFPLSLWTYYEAKNIVLIESLKRLDHQTIRSIEISPATRPNKDLSLLITNPNDLKIFAESLSVTTPYSPNHESIKEVRRVTVMMKSGGRFDFNIGKGNRANAETVWLEFGVKVYQNPALYRALFANSQLNPW